MAEDIADDRTLDESMTESIRGLLSEIKGRGDSGLVVQFNHILCAAQAVCSRAVKCQASMT